MNLLVQPDSAMLAVAYNVLLQFYTNFHTVKLSFKTTRIDQIKFNEYFEVFIFVTPKTLLSNQLIKDIVSVSAGCQRDIVQLKCPLAQKMMLFGF